MSEKEAFKRVVDEEEKGTYADLRNVGDGLGREEIVKREEMKARMEKMECACDDEVEEEKVLVLHGQELADEWGRDKW